jgi:hypothetical protein
MLLQVQPHLRLLVLMLLLSPTLPALQLAPLAPWQLPQQQLHELTLLLTVLPLQLLLLLLCCQHSESPPHQQQQPSQLCY